MTKWSNNTSFVEPQDSKSSTARLRSICFTIQNEMFGKEQPVSGFIDNAFNLKHMQYYSM